MVVARSFVERAFEDAKGAFGMADFQARGWQALLHHMALQMDELIFLPKERLAHRDTADLLSCNDLVEIVRHKLMSFQWRIEMASDKVKPVHFETCRSPINGQFDLNGLCIYMLGKVGIHCLTVMVFIAALTWHGHQTSYWPSPFLPEVGFAQLVRVQPR